MPLDACYPKKEGVTSTMASSLASLQAVVTREQGPVSPKVKMEGEKGGEDEGEGWICQRTELIGAGRGV